MEYVVIALLIAVFLLAISGFISWRRIRVLNEDLLTVENEHSRIFALQGERVLDIEEFIASREPCTTCGHHRYRQKTLHNGCVK